jgi:hypothetical protein
MKRRDKECGGDKQNGDRRRQTKPGQIRIYSCTYLCHEGVRSRRVTAPPILKLIIVCRWELGFMSGGFIKDYVLNCRSSGLGIRRGRALDLRESNHGSSVF